MLVCSRWRCRPRARLHRTCRTRARSSSTARRPATTSSRRFARSSKATTSARASWREKIVARDKSSFMGQMVLGFAQHYAEDNLPRSLFHLDNALALYEKRLRRSSGPGRAVALARGAVARDRRRARRHGAPRREARVHRALQRSVRSGHGRRARLAADEARAQQGSAARRRPRPEHRPHVASASSRSTRCARSSSRPATTAPATTRASARSTTTWRTAPRSPPST